VRACQKNIFLFSYSILYSNVISGPTASLSTSDLHGIIPNYKRKLTHFIHEQYELDRPAIEKDKSILEALRIDELIPHNRTTVLCSTKLTLDVSIHLKRFHDMFVKVKQDPKTAQGASTSGTSATKKPRTNEEHKEPGSSGTPHNKSRPMSTPTGPPIIIVPNSRTGVISSLNIADFLGNSVYESIEQKLAAGAKRVPGDITVRRAVAGSGGGGAGGVVEYKVLDDPRHLRDEEWARVVAVFALGEEWQFKAWKWSKPAELFQHVLGVHVTMDDRSMDDKTGRTVLSWNCKVLKVNKSKRHLDANAVNEFWGLLDDFVRLRKPYLLNLPDKGYR